MPQRESVRQRHHGAGSVPVSKAQRMEDLIRPHLGLPSFAPRLPFKNNRLLQVLQHRASPATLPSFKAPGPCLGDLSSWGWPFTAQHKGPGHSWAPTFRLSLIREPVTIWTQLIMAEGKGEIEGGPAPQSLSAPPLPPPPGITSRTKKALYYLPIPSSGNDRGKSRASSPSPGLGTSSVPSRLHHFPHNDPYALSYKCWCPFLLSAWTDLIPSTSRVYRSFCFLSAPVLLPMARPLSPDTPRDALWGMTGVSFICVPHCPEQGLPLTTLNLKFLLFSILQCLGVGTVAFPTTFTNGETGSVVNDLLTKVTELISGSRAKIPTWIQLSPKPALSMQLHPASANVRMWVLHIWMKHSSCLEVGDKSFPLRKIPSW